MVSDNDLRYSLPVRNIIEVIGGGLCVSLQALCGRSTIQCDNDLIEIYVIMYPLGTGEVNVAL